MPVKTSAMPQTTKLSARAPMNREATQDVEMRCIHCNMTSFSCLLERRRMIGRGPRQGKLRLAPKSGYFGGKSRGKSHGKAGRRKLENERLKRQPGRAGSVAGWPEKSVLRC